MEFDVETAKNLQTRLSRLVVTSGMDLSRVRYVAGLDVSYSGSWGIAVAALANYPQLELVEYVVVEGAVSVPYVPGLLAFREAPLLFKACESLSTEPDLLVVDGHGVTHPRRFGIASHIGVVLDKPSIGVAKSLLYGRVSVVSGEKVIVIDDLVGGLVVSRGRRELYFSIGHRVDLNNLRELSKTLFKRHELPEPTYFADRLSREVRGSATRR
ncbi:MAG: endonuclease V [Sulfolobales archaeon]|nr:endonuclease V [Sulfolobales archaeon]MDW8010234.1 endonuclease V [Sulfolobales archaeon]